MRNLWVIRPEPNYTNRLREFLEQGMMAIGWPGMGDLSGGLSREDISQRLRATYTHYETDQKHDLSVAAGILDRFVNQVKVGDYVLVPEEPRFYIGEVLSDYIFKPELDNDGADAGYPHWRAVRYLKNGESFAAIKNLPLGARRAVECHLTFFSIHSAAKETWAFLGIDHGAA
ncbi:MAG: hypothetical protein LBO66_14085 [Deltaproteobacteria bacterium]|jgi:predicted Mrr-cat superfamily restriction endonuclease|nr:hypothetical protein [Deltaproteobacteria bacterium]